MRTSIVIAALISVVGWTSSFSGQRPSESVEWGFQVSHSPDRKSQLPLPGIALADLERTPDSLRVTLSEGTRLFKNLLAGGIYIDLPGWQSERWTEIWVQARTSSGVNRMLVGLNAGRAPFPSARRAYGSRRFRQWAVRPRSCATATFTPIESVSIGATSEPACGDYVGLEFGAASPGSVDILTVRSSRLPPGRGASSRRRSHRRT